MSVKTKIVVLHMKRIVFAGVAVGLGLLMLIILFASLHARSKPEPESVPTLYTPGIYTSSIMMDQSSMDVQVVVDENNIKSISMVNLDETMETMYPLMKPTLKELSRQIIRSQSTDNITYSQNNQYTSMLLLDAVHNALKKASHT